MATTVTKRVSGALAESTTKRVPSTSLDPSDYYAWGSSWGSHVDGATSWGDSWRIFQSLAALGHTVRVTGAITQSITKRVTGVV